MANKWLGGVRPGQADVTIAAFFRATADNTELTGLTATDITASYWRQGGSRVAITVSDLTAIDDAHSDGGFFEVDGTNMPGLYRFDVPDAAYASGADWVVVTLTTANGFAFNERFNISKDLQNSNEIWNEDITMNEDDSTPAGMLLLTRRASAHIYSNFLSCGNWDGGYVGDVIDQVAYSGVGATGTIQLKAYTGDNFVIETLLGEFDLSIPSFTKDAGWTGEIDSSAFIVLYGAASVGGTLSFRVNGVSEQGVTGPQNVSVIVAPSVSSLTMYPCKDGSTKRLPEGATIVSIPPQTNANLVSIDGNPTNNNTAELRLKRLDVNNSDGSAVVIRSANNNAMRISGGEDGSGGHGLQITSGSEDAAVRVQNMSPTTGIGVEIYGNVTQGDGLRIYAPAGRAVSLEAGGGPTLAISNITGQVGDDGAAVLVTAVDGFGIGIHTQSSPAIRMDNSGGNTFEITSQNGTGLRIHSEGNINGRGVFISSYDGHALQIASDGTNRSGIEVGSTAGKGINIVTTDGDGIFIDAGGAGLDINAPNSNIGGILLANGAIGPDTLAQELEDYETLHQLIVGFYSPDTGISDVNIISGAFPGTLGFSGKTSMLDRNTPWTELDFGSLASDGTWTPGVNFDSSARGVRVAVQGGAPTEDVVIEIVSGVGSKMNFLIPAGSTATRYLKADGTTSAWGATPKSDGGVAPSAGGVGDANMVSIAGTPVAGISDFAAAVLDEPQASHTVPGSIAVSLSKPQYVTDSGCTTSDIIVSSGPSTDNMFVGQVLTLIAGDPVTGAGQSRRITGYTALTNTFTVDPPFAVAPTALIPIRIDQYVSPGTVEKNITNITYNPDGTVNVITHQDSTTITFAYTGGKITSVVYG